jgi:hypothetical protein
MATTRSLKDRMFGDFSAPVSPMLFEIMREIQELLRAYENYLHELHLSEQVHKKLLAVRALMAMPKTTNLEIKEFKKQFAASAETLSHRRYIPIGTSVGGEIVSDINVKLASYFVEEFIIKELLELVESYKRHLTNANVDNNDPILAAKIATISVLEAKLEGTHNLTTMDRIRDKKAADKLSEFAHDWNIESTQNRFRQHRTHSPVLKFFIAHDLFHSEGQKFVEKVNVVMEKLAVKKGIKRVAKEDKEKYGIRLI